MNKHNFGIILIHGVMKLKLAKIVIWRLLLHSVRMMSRRGPFIRSGRPVKILMKRRVL